MATEVCDSSQLANVAAERIAALLTSAIAAEGSASIALAGGTTPRAAYEELARKAGIDWSRVHVYFGDERAVPPTHADSNFRMAEAALFSRVALPADNIHRVQAELEDREAVALAYEALLPETFSVMVLGIGEDGHTASLFPGSPALHEHARRFLPVLGPKPPPERYSVTPPVILAARKIVVLANGAGKADAIARALEGPVDIHQTPSSMARQGLWLLDAAAAAKLSH